MRKRVSGEPRGGFPLAGTNFNPRTGLFDAGQWQADLELLADQHRQLRAAVAALDASALARTAGGRPLAWTIRGAAAHDFYHAGQIQLLRPSRHARDHTKGNSSMTRRPILSVLAA